MGTRLDSLVHVARRSRACSLVLVFSRFTVGFHSSVSFHRGSQRATVYYSAEPKRSKSRSDFQGNEGPSTLGRTFIDISLSFDRLPFNLSGTSGELFEHFESAVDSLIKYARLTAMTNLCRRHSTAARWEPLWCRSDCLNGDQMIDTITRA